MRSNRGKRIFKETSEAPVWYLQLWQSLTVDLTSERGIISTIDKSGFLRTFTSTIMPGIASVLIIAPIVNTWLTLKNFYRSKNKNLDKALDLFVNIFMTLTSVGVMATLLAGFVYVSPYILLSAMMVSLSYGIYNVTKHLHAAWRANEEGDNERVKQHLWSAPYHAVLTILSCLGLLVQLHYAFNMVPFKGMFRLVQVSNSSYTVAQMLLYVFGFTLTLSTMPVFARQIMEYNNETWKLISNPKANLTEFLFGKEGPEGHVNGLWDNMKNGYAFSRANPLRATVLFIPTLAKLTVELIGYTAIAGMRLIAGLLAPLQLLGTQVTKAIGFISNFISPPPQIKDLRVDPMSTDQHMLNSSSARLTLKQRHSKLKTAMQEELKHLDTQDQTSAKIKSKWHFVNALSEKLGDKIENFNTTTSVDTIEADAMKISPYLYQSFWRQEGRVEKIARQFDELEEGMQKAANLQYIDTPGEGKSLQEEKEQEQDNNSLQTSLIRSI